MDSRLCTLWNKIVQYRLVKITSDTVSNDAFLVELKDIRRSLSSKSRETESKHSSLLGLRSHASDEDIYRNTRKALQLMKELRSKDERVIYIVNQTTDLLTDLDSLNEDFTTYLNEVQRMFTLYFKNLRNAFQEQFLSTRDIFRDIQKQYETTQRTLQQWKGNQLSSAVVEEKKLKGDLKDWAIAFMSYVDSVMALIQFFSNDDYRRDIRFDYERSRKPPKNSYDCKVPSRLRNKVDAILTRKKLKTMEVYEILKRTSKNLKAMMVTLDHPQAKMEEFVVGVLLALFTIQDHVTVRVLQPTRMFITKNQQRVAKELADTQVNIGRQNAAIKQLQLIEQGKVKGMGPHVSKEDMEKHRLLQESMTGALDGLNNLLVKQHSIQKMQAEMMATVQAAATACPKLDTFENVLAQLQNMNLQKEDILKRFDDKNQEAEKDYQRQCHTLMSNSLNMLQQKTSRLHDSRQALEQELWNAYYEKWLHTQERLALVEKSLVQRRNLDFKDNINPLSLELDGIVEFTRQFQDQRRSECAESQLKRYLSLVKKTVNE